MNLVKIKIEENEVDVVVTLTATPSELYRLEDILQEAAVSADQYDRCKTIVELSEATRVLAAKAAKLYHDAEMAKRQGVLSTMAGDFHAVED